MNKQEIIAALYKFTSKRSGIEWGNYGERESFMGDYRQIVRQGREARRLLRFVELSPAITADAILRAVGTGRIQFTRQGESVSVDFTTCQYFPTEYRASVCRLLSSVVWAYFRELANPATDCTETAQGGIVNAGEYIRRKARREFGRGLAGRWFN